MADDQVVKMVGGSKIRLIRRIPDPAPLDDGVNERVLDLASQVESEAYRRLRESRRDLVRENMRLLAEKHQRSLELLKEYGD